MNGTDLKLLWCLESLPLFLMVAIILINNAESQKYERKSDCDTLLPHISTDQHLGSSTELSTFAPEGGYRFKIHNGDFFRLTFSFFSLILSCSLVPCTHKGEQAHTHTHTSTHAHAHTDTPPTYIAYTLYVHVPPHIATRIHCT